eukprot:gene8551-biopygen6571
MPFTAPAIAYVWPPNQWGLDIFSPPYDATFCPVLCPCCSFVIYQSTCRERDPNCADAALVWCDSDTDDSPMGLGAPEVLHNNSRRQLDPRGLLGLRAQSHSRRPNTGAVGNPIDDVFSSRAGSWKASWHNRF